MKDMDRAVERVERAVANNEKIMVYGDYDVDGCTAVALVYKFLRQIGHKNLMFYIPDRYTEGYGISIKGIDLAARKGVGLIIALDCGIKATEKIVYAKTKGVDFIICDHHLPAEEIPKCRSRSGSQAGRLLLPVRRTVGLRRGIQARASLCTEKRHPLRADRAAAGPAGRVASPRTSCRWWARTVSWPISG